MITKQLWRPDTCSCHIEQTFDYDTNPATLVESKIIVACPLHSDVASVLEDNIAKNKGVGFISSTLSKTSEEIEWSVDKASGDINIKTPTNTAVNDKTAIKAEFANISDKLKLV